jgi:hypothetical protein
MNSHTKIAVCTVLILSFISATVYGVFVSLWRASVTVTITASSFKKPLQISTRPYVPIADLTVNYELVGEIGGESVYKVSGIQLRLVGFTGYYKVFVRDSNKNIIWSTSGFSGTGCDKTFAPILNVKDSYEIGVSVKGIDDITALVKPFLKFTDWYRKAAEELSKNDRLVNLILKSINSLADMLKPEDVNIWMASPIAFAKTSVTQFDPGTPQWEESPLLARLLLASMHSSGELRVYDSEGRVTGLVRGEIKEEIPNSVYFNDTVIIFPANDSYTYEIAGVEDGLYGLVAGFVAEGENEGIAFMAVDIPISLNAIHQYAINWDALSTDEGGTLVKVDSDNNGIFEYVFASDDELDQDEFTVAAIRFYAIWDDVNYPVYVSTNSTISSFTFNQLQKMISFDLKGATDAKGYCKVTIPKALLRGEPWTVRLNGTEWDFILTSNETHSFIYFTYTHMSTYEVTIQGTWVIPEFPSTIVLSLSILTTLIATILLKKKIKPKPL